MRSLMCALGYQGKLDNILCIQEVQDPQGDGRLVAQHPFWRESVLEAAMPECFQLSVPQSLPHGVYFLLPLPQMNVVVGLEDQTVLYAHEPL